VLPSPTKAQQASNSNLVEEVDEANKLEQGATATKVNE
jgi:hypothetical protein